MKIKQTIEDIARELLDSEYCNGWGIRSCAVRKACEENNIEFKVLFAEIIKGTPVPTAIIFALSEDG